MGKNPLAITPDGLTYVMLDRAHCDTLWKFSKVPARDKEIWRPVLSEDFAEWAGRSLKAGYQIRRIEIDPEHIPDGFDELEKARRRHEHYQKIRYIGENKEPPTTLKRWTITFGNEIDGLMFKLKWL